MVAVRIGKLEFQHFKGPLKYSFNEKDGNRLNQVLLKEFSRPDCNES